MSDWQLTLEYHNPDVEYSSPVIIHLGEYRQNNYGYTEVVFAPPLNEEERSRSAGFLHKRRGSITPQKGSGDKRDPAGEHGGSILTARPAERMGCRRDKTIAASLCRHGMCARENLDTGKPLAEFIPVFGLTLSSHHERRRSRKAHSGTGFGGGGTTNGRDPFCSRGVQDVIDACIIFSRPSLGVNHAAQVAPRTRVCICSPIRPYDVGTVPYKPISARSVDVSDQSRFVTTGVVLMFTIREMHAPNCQTAA
ncbi:hypothetical protein V8F06_000095 [Rhypophila decipiens]